MTRRIEELIEISDTEKLTKKGLLYILKKEAANIDIQMIMKATNFIKEDARFMQSPYREDYVERFSKAFVNGINHLKGDKVHYSGNVDVVELKSFLKVQKTMESEVKSEKELCFVKIARVVSLYATFIREEPIHPRGTKFPGGQKSRFIKGRYLCPAKERQIHNPSALCRFCVSEQDRDISTIGYEKYRC